MDRELAYLMLMYFHYTIKQTIRGCMASSVNHSFLHFFLHCTNLMQCGTLNTVVCTHWIIKEHRVASSGSLTGKFISCLYVFKCCTHWWADTNDKSRRALWFSKAKLWYFPCFPSIIEKPTDWLMYVCTVYNNTLVSLYDVSISLFQTH